MLSLLLGAVCPRSTPLRRMVKPAPEAVRKSRRRITLPELSRFADGSNRGAGPRAVSAVMPRWVCRATVPAVDFAIQLDREPHAAQLNATESIPATCYDQPSGPHEVRVLSSGRA